MEGAGHKDTVPKLFSHASGSKCTHSTRTILEHILELCVAVAHFVVFNHSSSQLLPQLVHLIRRHHLCVCLSVCMHVCVCV